MFELLREELIFLEAEVVFMPPQRISVAMCTYNGSRYIWAQLNSIASQTRLPDELVVCDDASSDNTLEIIDEFAAKAPFPVRIYTNNKNIGTTRNFEKAMSLCEGDIIFLSDQDDVWYLDKISLMEHVFSTLPDSGVVFSDAEIVDEHLNPLGYSLWQSIGFNRAEQDRVANGEAPSVLLKHNVVTGATMAFRKEFMDVIVPIPNIWIHDAWIALIIGTITRLAFIPQPLIKYRQHSKQQIGAVKMNFIERVVKSSQTGQEDYEKAAAQYALAYERLLKIFNVYHVPREVLLHIERKERHLMVRAGMYNKKKIYRLPCALIELVFLRYHRYSGGWKSFAKDILLR